MWFLEALIREPLCGRRTKHLKRGKVLWLGKWRELPDVRVSFLLLRVLLTHSAHVTQVLFFWLSAVYLARLLSHVFYVGSVCHASLLSLMAVRYGKHVHTPIPHEGFPQSHAIQDQNKFVKSIHVEKVPRSKWIRTSPSASSFPFGNHTWQAGIT